MSIQSEITRIAQNVSDSFDAVAAKGGTRPQAQNSSNLPDAILSIPAAGVQSFNGRTGDVEPQEGDYTAEMVGAQPTINVSGILKGNGSGGVIAATPNSDYLAVPSGGSDGDVLKKTSSGTEWGKAGDSVPALDEDVIYYVSSSGSDSGDGTQGSPFATVAHALSLIPKNLNGHVAQINVLSNLTESITIFGYYAGTLRLYGQNTCTITGGIYIDSCSASILLTEFAGYAAASAEYAIRANNSSDIKLWCEYVDNNCSISSGSEGAIRADSSSVRIGSGNSQTWTISGNSVCISAYTTSQIALNAKFALSGSVGIQSLAGSVIGINSSSFTNNASTKYSYNGGLAVKGSVINPTS